MLAIALIAALAAESAVQDPSALRDGEVTLADFQFASGESLPVLRMHYKALGQPRRNARGVVENAVLILHGTTGSSDQFLRDEFAGQLFGKGQLLDAAKMFIVIPDGVGHGQSSKPSDGLHARFPHYGYGDMVEAQRQLLGKLGVDHLRVLIGTSMGCMQAWLWLEAQPAFIDAALPLACLPVQIAGRNRMMRKMAIDAIRSDPAWAGGDYQTQPLLGLRAALDALFVMSSSALVLQGKGPTRDEADRYYEDWIKQRLATTDANDFLYAFDSSRDYDPQPQLEKIEAAVIAVNSADDYINPPELGILQRELKRVRRGKAVILPIGDATRGHGTHTLAALWKQFLAELLGN